jgi:hypothetical protein
MASALVLASLWAALCVRDPEHPGCQLRPGQCYESSMGIQVCRAPEALYEYKSLKSFKK